MKIVKTALVSTISLGIAISTAALAANPNPDPFGVGNSPARQNATSPRIPPNGKRTCASDVLALPAGINTDVGVGVTFFIGIPRAVALLFSAEQFTAGTIFLTYSIDGGAAAPLLGLPAPGQNFSIDASAATRTAQGIVFPALPAGTHTIRPFLQSIGGAGAVRLRCFEVSP
jgi:hypothetical protein